MREYSALRLNPLPPGARLTEPRPPGHVGLDDPAYAVMTDLREVAPVTTTPDEPADRAHTAMIQHGVRLLFVLGEGGALAGVITATDLLGEKPMRFTQERGVRHGELQVGDLMTPASLLEAISLQDVAQMRVGHIVATLKAIGRQHVMVAEAGNTRVRGIFSASQVARQLGMPLQTFEIASTFADIEAALARS